MIAEVSWKSRGKSRSCYASVEIGFVTGKMGGAACKLRGDRGREVMIAQTGEVRSQSKRSKFVTPSTETERNLIERPLLRGYLGGYPITDGNQQRPVTTLKELIDQPDRLLDDYVESIEGACNATGIRWNTMSNDTVEQCERLLGLAQQRVENQENKVRLAKLRLTMLQQQWQSLLTKDVDGIYVYTDSEKRDNNMQMARTIIAIAKDANIEDDQHEVIAMAKMARRTIMAARQREAQEALKSKPAEAKPKGEGKGKKTKGSGN